MPISLRAPVRRLSQKDFGELAYEVMRHVFAIHSELGRFFDERIYKQELANRLHDVRLEEPIDVVFDSFQKRYILDVLVSDGGIFEFKAAEKLVKAHRAQLLHYLMLCDVGHGKLINVRPETVEHDFVNTTLRHSDRLHFGIEADRWDRSISGAEELQERLTGMMRDWGSGLEIALYEEGITHFFGGAERVEADVAVLISGRRVGTQRMRLTAPGVALKITALTDRLDRFESHARRLLTHLDLRAIAWVNFNVKQLTFTTLER